MRPDKPSYLLLMMCLGLLTMAVLSLVSCTTTASSPNWPAHHPWEVEPQLSNELHVNLFLDASQSMRGFVKHGTGNYYLPVVEQLESLGGTGGWNRSEVKWWKFGNHVTEIPKSQRLIFQSPDFYTETRTQIDEVFSKSAPGDLTVIITDLFQSHNDVGLMSRRLDERYLAGLRQSGKNTPAAISPAVGLMGIQTRFEGRVSELGDLDGRERSVPHIGTLPFYILVLGPLPDVERFLNRIDSRFPELAQNRQRLVFTERIIRHLSAKPVLASRREGFSIESNLIPGASGRDDRVLQLQVPASGPGKPGEGRKLDIVADCDLVPTGLVIDQQNLRTSVQVEVPGPDGKFQPDSQAASAVHVSSVKLDSNQLKLGIDLHREQLRTGRDYRVEIRVYPAENAYQLPKSLNDWNLSTIEVDSIIVNNGFGKGKPGRTLNLQMFLDNLRDSTFLGKEPPINIVYLYIKAS